MDGGESGDSRQRIEQREKINDQMVEMLNNRLSNLEQLGAFIFFPFQIALVLLGFVCINLPVSIHQHKIDVMDLNVT
jgi:hypothetical protein